MDVSDAKKLRALEEENGKLKGVIRHSRQWFLSLYCRSMWHL
jgi:hypothetical protein